MIGNVKILSVTDAQNPSRVMKTAIDTTTGETLGSACAEHVTGQKRYATRNFLKTYATNEWTPYSGLHAKPHIYLEMIRVEDGAKRKGIGRRLIQSVVSDSFEKGCDGRVIVCAQNPKSPLPFYRKIGFSSGNIALDKRIDKFLEFPLGTFRENMEVMMLPKKAAKAFVKMA